MDSASEFILTLTSFGGSIGAAERFVFFVLNSEEFVLRNEGEVF
jgi:hypothetical protein